MRCIPACRWPEALRCERRNVMDYDFNKWMSDYRVISTVGLNEEGGLDRLAFTDYDLNPGPIRICRRC